MPVSNPHRSNCSWMKDRIPWRRRCWTPTCSFFRSTSQPPLCATSLLRSDSLYKRCRSLTAHMVFQQKLPVILLFEFPDVFCRVLQFPSAFFQGKADLCGCLCYEILKCCNHRSSSTQTEASALLYFFMRKNFEFTKGKSIVRSHLQVGEAEQNHRCLFLSPHPHSHASTSGHQGSESADSGRWHRRLQISAVPGNHQ